MNALLDYGNSIRVMANELAPIPSTPSNQLQEYQTNYFNYYTQVNNFFSSSVRSQFSSIFDPYNSLEDGSSCGFVTTSMNGIVDVACNQMFPYFNTLSTINIICSVLAFILFLLSYFLTVRYQFYEFL
eukprot:TRINITY_DN26873_c0_g1_i1.p1 TRINITY_DN26873_c0_g1~~TRINITY_DN26873_c0_g1_i1.p1  ORF type:complete len:128 (+),score=0.99 TRINITY_DN26873_c0_g1_i1:329-712(+)